MREMDGGDDAPVQHRDRPWQTCTDQCTDQGFDSPGPARDRPPQAPSDGIRTDEVEPTRAALSAHMLCRRRQLGGRGCSCATNRSRRCCTSTKSGVRPLRKLCHPVMRKWTSVLDRPSGWNACLVPLETEAQSTLQTASMHSSNKCELTLDLALRRISVVDVAHVRVQPFWEIRQRGARG